MKLLLIADGRSPITARWIESVRRLNVRVWLVSTYPCKAPEGVEKLYVLPVAFAKYSGSQARRAAQSATPEKKFAKTQVKRFRNLFMKARYYLGPLSLLYYRPKLYEIVRNLRPDLVHALRIPYEGMLAAGLPADIPLAVSIWGNDLTLHAQGSFLMRWFSRETLRRADGLSADTRRDIRLAHDGGLSPEKQTLVVPGNGGISLTEIRLTAQEGQSQLSWLPRNYHIVINPRGFRPGSVRNDTYFKSIPLILEQIPNTLFICLSMDGQPEALEWVNRLQIANNVVLLPTLKQQDLWPLFTRSEVTITVSQHDGTPNSLLEAMSLGCFPVAGDIESMREWITPGVNGMLVDPDSPEALANAVITALNNPALRQQAAEFNSALICEKAEITTVSPAIGVFYQTLAIKAQRSTAHK